MHRTGVLLKTFLGTIRWDTAPGKRISKLNIVGRAGLTAEVATTGHGRTVVCLILFLLLWVVLVLTIPIEAPPPIAMRTQGQAFDQFGSPLPSGTPIRTFVDGVEYSDQAQVQDGIGSFVVLTSGNSKTNPNVSDTPDILEGPNSGDIVILAAGDFTASTPVFIEVEPWFPERNVTRDLTLGSGPSIPQPVKINGLVPQPAQGGNQFVVLCNPTASSVSLANYYLERNLPGSYRGPQLNLTTTLGAGSKVRVNLTSPSWMDGSGDALKLVFRNPGGASAAAGGRDLVVDRVEFNATRNGTLIWEPANTIMEDAPAPGPGRILQRDVSCTDTNTPADFAVADEPGLPANGPPTVSIVSPASGETVPPGTTVTFTWTLSDDVFVDEYLHVWANVTLGNQTIPLVVDGMGVTSATWLAPNAAVFDVVVRVDVEDPFEEHASATRTFDVTEQSILIIVVAVLIVAVLVGLLLFAFWRARKKERTPPPMSPPPPMAPAGSVGAPPTGIAEGLAAANRKTCPRCHKSVNAVDVTCFYCGYKFPNDTNPPP
jgi:hypothetical protein